MKRPAIFTDRDGTLVHEVNYLSRVEDLRLFEFTRPAVESLKREGYLVVVVTNQSGIGRGIYTEDDMHRIHDAMQAELDGAIDGFYFCPHLPDSGCECRKPGLKMLTDAVGDLDIDLAASWMVGDKLLDIQTGLAANLRTSMVLTGYGDKHKSQLDVLPDIIAGHFGEFAERLLEERRGLRASEIVL